MLGLSQATAQGPRPMVGQLVCHQANPGEDLVQIASRYRLTVDHLAYANGFPITTLSVEPGTRVWVPGCRILPANPPHNGVVINLPERLLFLFRRGRFDGYYPLSIGDEVAEGGRFQTPTGHFRIIEKLKSPTWYPPAWAKDRTPVPPGPNNPLGEYWVGLSLPRTGVHGTNDPLNVGNSVTHGCMRMYPHLLKEFYDKVGVGFEARIEYETSKLGRDAQGRIYLVTFPDVYGKSDPLKRTQALLLQARLRPVRRNFSDVMGLLLGIPVEVRGHNSVEQEFCQRAGVSESD
ncbi:L,D-transpeptidase [bacterium]|nr:L,D-transpeptidase [bacterium]